MTLIEVLRNGRQHDEDGVMVVMSRQACEEAAGRLERIEAAFQALRDGHQHGSSNLYRTLAAEFPIKLTPEPK